MYRPLPPDHLIPNGKPLLLICSRWDVVCLCIHRVVQDTKNIILNPCDSVCLHYLHSFPVFFFTSDTPHHFL